MFFGRPDLASVGVFPRAMKGDCTDQIGRSRGVYR